MRRAAIAVALALALGAVGCKGKREGKDTGKAPTRVASPAADAGGPPPPRRAPQVTPPLPVAAPPADAERLTGVEGAPQAVIAIKRLTAGTGARPGRNDTVQLNFTGWRTSGETFLSTTVRKRPVTQSLAVLAPGFAVAVASMQVGERAMMWIPPELGYMGEPADTPETTVYEVELVGFEPGPATPPDVGLAPPTARKTASGVPYVVVKRGTGKVKPRDFDFVTMSYSAWSSTGRMFDSTEVTKQPRRTFPFREPIGLAEVLRTMVVGERVRLWLPPGAVEKLPTTPAGQLCFEIELTELKAMHAPPPVPADVAAPPAAAARTAKGVAYQVLKPGLGNVHPTPTDRVKVAYTGWLTSGRLFDSSEVRGEPAAFIMSKVIPGLAEGLATMVVGERTRFWIPVELAYDHQPGSPPGMLVFEIELLEIMAPPPRPTAPTPGVVIPGPGAPPP